MIPLTRRALVTGVGLALIVPVTGCGVDPRIHRRIALDQQLPAWRGDLVDQLRLATAVTRAQDTDWAPGLADAFTEQAARLASPDPLAGFQADLTPLPRFSSPATPSTRPTTQLSALVTTIAETARAARGQDLDTGSALLLTSVEILARLVVDTDPAQLLAPASGPMVPAEITLDATSCWQQVVRATDALVFALGAALGHTTDPARFAVLSQRLGEAQRDQQQVVLAAADHDVAWTTDPDPEMSTDVSDVTSQDELIGSLELQVMNTWARIHALDSELGVGEAVVHAQRAMICGVPVPFWPGWA